MATTDFQERQTCHPLVKVGENGKADFRVDGSRRNVVGIGFAHRLNQTEQLTDVTAHAEIMALSVAQQRLGTFDLGGPGLPAHQLVVNWRPCAMCYGAVPWSGVRQLVVAGDGPELEQITGFDEGPCHPDWLRELEGLLRAAGIRTALVADGDRPTTV